MDGNTRSPFSNILILTSVFDTEPLNYKFGAELGQKNHVLFGHHVILVAPHRGFIDTTWDGESQIRSYFQCGAPDDLVLDGVPCGSRNSDRVLIAR